MTVTIQTDRALEYTSEPIDFTTTRRVSSVSVEYNPELGNGARETVFDGTNDDGTGGDFSFLYRNSTRSEDGLTWHIVRTGRWPARLRLRVVEVSNAATFGIGSLQPTLYTPVAQWALRGAPDTSVLYLDRSGNARHLTSGTATPVPDQIPGQTAIFSGSLKGTFAALRAYNGPLTVTARCFIRAGGSTQTFFSTGGLDEGTNGLGSFYVDGSKNLSYFYETGSNVGHAYNSTLTLPVGQWVYVSLVRDSAGAVRLGLNQSYQASGALGLPTVVGLASTAIGCNTAGTNPFLGGLADVCVWTSALTDSQLAPLYKAAMGIP